MFPFLVNQTTQMINSVVDFIKVHIQIQIKYCNLLINTWKNLTYSQLQNGASMILRYIQDIGAVGLSFVMSFILSSSL